mmetsp:Transcript_30102/g.46092  ORF Transcript_30102/g.46092 Transcript_30102/m.46092 type:complete len:360 (-) Transcript_30102:270-1349(-)
MGLSNVDSEMGPDDIAAFEKGVFEFLDKGVDAVKTTSVMITGQELLTAEEAAATGLDGRRLQEGGTRYTNRVSLTVTGEYRPPPYEDMNSLVSDTIDADPDGLKDSLNDASGGGGYFQNINVIPPVAKTKAPSKAPATQPKSAQSSGGFGVAQIMMIAAGLLAIIFILTCTIFCIRHNTAELDDVEPYFDTSSVDDKKKKKDSLFSKADERGYGFSEEKKNRSSSANERQVGFGFSRFQGSRTAGERAPRRPSTGSASVGSHGSNHRSTFERISSFVKRSPRSERNIVGNRSPRNDKVPVGARNDRMGVSAHSAVRSVAGGASVSGRSEARGGRSVMGVSQHNDGRGGYTSVAQGGNRG